jgi:hypothetical protein
MFETVITNLYGNTAEQYRPSPGWRAEYARYLEGYESAEDKLEFNVFCGHQERIKGDA